MCSASSEDIINPKKRFSFEEIQDIVEKEFTVEESILIHDVPTFHIKYQKDSKDSFLRLLKTLDSLELIPLLRKKEEKVVLRIVSKPPVKANREILLERWHEFFGR